MGRPRRRILLFGGLINIPGLKSNSSHFHFLLDKHEKVEARVSCPPVDFPDKVPAATYFIRNIYRELNHAHRYKTKRLVCQDNFKDK